MSIRLNRSIEILEPLLLMSATAIDSQDADIAVAPDALSAVDPFALDAADAIAGPEIVFAEQADQSATVDPVQAESVVTESVEVPLVAPVGVLAEAPLDAPIDALVQAPVEPPVDVLTETDVNGEVPDGAFVDAPIDALPEAPVDATVDTTAEAPVDVLTETDVNGEVPDGAFVDAPIDALPEAPVDATVDTTAEAPLDVLTETDVNDEVPDGALVDAPVEGPIGGPFEGPIDGPVNDPIDALDDAPVDLESLVDDTEYTGADALITSPGIPMPAVITPPVAVHDYNYTTAGESIDGSVLCNDINESGGQLTAVLSTPPQNGDLTLNENGTYTYSPNPGFSGMDEFEYTVTSSQGGSSTTAVCIEVGETGDSGSDNGNPADVADGPIAVDDDIQTEFNTAVEGNLVSNDIFAADDTLEAWVEVGPENGSITLNVDGSYVYTPDPGFSGTDTFTYSINNSDGTTSTATVSIEVGPQPENAAPVAVDDTNTTPFETAVEGNVLSNDSDPEGDALQAWVEVGPVNGSITLNTDGSYIYTPDPGFSGTETFTYSISDSEGNTTVASVTIEVGTSTESEVTEPEHCETEGTTTNSGAENTAAENSEPEQSNEASQGPVAADDRASGDAGSTITGNVLVNDADPDGDALSVAPVTDFQTAESGTVSLKQDGTFTYEPAAGYSGVDFFTYVVSDADGNTATATVSIDVKPVELIAQDDSYTVVNNGQVIIGQVTENDGPNPGSPTVTLLNGPASGTVVLQEDGTFEYRPNEGFSGQDRFDYVLTSGTQTATATATLIVSRVQYDQTHASAGNGRIWGDPHFEGDDGGLYDVQGEAGKIYSLLSDQNLQVNALFIPWELHPGSTMLGEIGITSGSDQIVADANGTVVNGVTLKAGETLRIADGTVRYDGQYTTITTGEYEVELNRRGGWYDMKLQSLDPFSDNVAPHGLWGLTVDADTEAREGDFFKTEGYDYTLQGGGAIDTVNADGEIVRTEKGDRAAYKLYETASLLSYRAANPEADVLFRFAAAEGTGLSPI